jgi:hypothetical protein
VALQGINSSVDSLSLLEENWRNQKTAMPNKKRVGHDLSFQSVQTNDNFEEVLKEQSKHNILKVLHRHGIPNEHQIAEIPGDEGHWDELTPDDDSVKELNKVEENTSQKKPGLRKNKHHVSEKTLDLVRTVGNRTANKLRNAEDAKKTIKVIPFKVSLAEI